VIDPQTNTGRVRNLCAATNFPLNIKVTQAPPAPAISCCTTLTTTYLLRCCGLSRRSHDASEFSTSMGSHCVRRYLPTTKKRKTLLALKVYILYVFINLQSASTKTPVKEIYSPSREKQNKKIYPWRRIFRQASKFNSSYPYPCLRREAQCPFQPPFPTPQATSSAHPNAHIPSPRECQR
jgi:hypothetical protein